MTTLNIRLSDELRDKAAARAAVSGHRSVEQYVEALVRQDTLEDRSPRKGGPAHLSPRNRDELIAMLDEGVRSGDPRPFTARELAAKKAALRRQAKSKQGSKQ
jgi:hypothetical protein